MVDKNNYLKKQNLVIINLVRIGCVSKLQNTFFQSFFKGELKKKNY